MDAAAADIYLSGSGVEVFVLQLSHRAAVYRVGSLCSEMFYIKEIGASSHLLVRGKADADFAVWNFRVGQEKFCHRHNLGYACLIVCSQKSRSVCDDEILSHAVQHTGEVLYPHDNLLFFVQY